MIRVLKDGRVILSGADYRALKLWTKRWKKAAEEKEARRKATLAKRAIQYDATFLEQCGIEHD